MGFPRKKLLVLDVNGLLVDTYYRNERRPTKELPNAKVGNFYVYKRPCCDEFLQFCLENFVVGIWSSARDYNVNNLVEYIFGELKQKLAFSWHQSDCTDSGLRAPDNNHKPLFLKELSKLWEKAKPDLPWNEGEYGPTNTLLVDDTPYKAIRNPPNTGIFPTSYTVCNSGDDFLGGELRNYLKGICDTANVQIYVENNPLGQPGIDSSSPYWNYLSQVILTVSLVASKVGDGIGKALDNLETTDTQQLAQSTPDSSKNHVPLLLDDTKSSGPIITYKRFGESVEVASQTVDHPINDDRNTILKGPLQPVNQETCGKHDTLEKKNCSSSKETKHSCSLRKIDELDDGKQTHKDNGNRGRHLNDVDVYSTKEPVPDDTKFSKMHDTWKLVQETPDSQKGHYLLDDDKNKYKKSTLQPVDHVKPPLKYGVGYYQPKRRRNSAIDNEETNGKLDSSSSSKRCKKFSPLTGINEVDDCKQMHEEKDYDRVKHIDVDVSSERVEGRRSGHWHFSRSEETHFGCSSVKSSEKFQVTRISDHFKEHSFPNTQRSGLEQLSPIRNGRRFFREKYNKKSCIESRFRQAFKEDRPMEQFDVERGSSVSRDRLVGLRSRYNHGQSDVWERIGEQANVGYAHMTLDNPHIRGSRMSHVQTDHPNGFLSESRFQSHNVGNELNCLISDESCHKQRETYRERDNFWGSKRRQGSNFVGTSMYNEGMNGHLTQDRGVLSSHKVHTVPHFTRSHFELHSNVVEHPWGTWNNQRGFHNCSRISAETCGDDGSVDREHGAPSQFFGSQRKWNQGHSQQTHRRQKDRKNRAYQQKWSVQ